MSDTALPFVVAKRLEHGTTNPIVARLTIQTLTLLEQCKVSVETTDAIANIYLNTLVKELLRCWEIKERLRVDADRKRAVYKFPGRGAVSIELPQIPRLEEDCRNFLSEARNYLRDLLQVFNLLQGTKLEEAGEWSRSRQGSQPVTDFAVKAFGPTHVNTAYLRQIPACIQPFIDMRNAVEHPKGYSGELKIFNFSLTADGKLADPIWSRTKEEKVEYGPLAIVDDMEVAIHNLLVLAEDVLIMWALTHLSLQA